MTVKGFQMIWRIILFAFATAAYADYDCHVSLWRGESLSLLLPDEACEVSGEAPGIEVQTGTLLPVRYLADNEALEYKTVADRAVYGSKAPGVHFATIMASRGADSGSYRFGNLVVTVVDRTLPPPREWKYYLDLWQHPWAVARVNGCEPFSPSHYKAMEPLWRQLADAGQKTLTVTLVDRPWNKQCRDAYRSMVVRRKDALGKWSFDYSRFDEYVVFGRACGIGPHISCYTMCPWEYVVDYEGPDGTSVKMVAKPGSAEFDDYWHDFLEDFVRHLKEKGWLSDTYVAMDERSPEDLDYIAKFVRRVAPGLKISVAGNRPLSAFAGIDIDSYSHSFRRMDDQFIRDILLRKRQGLITTYYVCCEPPRPNTFMGSGAGEAFVCSFYPVVLNLDGFLRWAYNSWGEDPLRDMTYRRWASGDTALVYPDGSPSWRFLELKNGIQQAEKFCILRDMGVRNDDLDELRKMFVLRDIQSGTDYARLRDKVIEILNKK